MEAVLSSRCNTVGARFPDQARDQNLGILRSTLARLMFSKSWTWTRKHGTDGDERNIGLSQRRLNYGSSKLALVMERVSWEQRELPTPTLHSKSLKLVLTGSQKRGS